MNGQACSVGYAGGFCRHRGPLGENHTGELPSVTISCKLNGNCSIGQATDAFQRLATPELPSSFSTSLQDRRGQGFQQFYQQPMDACSNNSGERLLGAGHAV